MSGADDLAAADQGAEGYDGPTVDHSTPGEVPPFPDGRPSTDALLGALPGLRYENDGRGYSASRCPRPGCTLTAGHTAEHFPAPPSDADLRAGREVEQKGLRYAAGIILGTAAKRDEARAERDALRAECRDAWRMFEAAKAQRDEARKVGAGFWPALAGQNDRDAWTFMAERDEARAEAERLRATVVRVEALADDISRHGSTTGYDGQVHTVVLLNHLRVALDPEKGIDA